MARFAGWRPAGRLSDAADPVAGRPPARVPGRPHGAPPSVPPAASPAPYGGLTGGAPYTPAVSQTPVQPGFQSLGQATSRAIAQRSSARGRLQRTLLVHGPAGSGKGAFVDDLLALLLCEATADQRPCNACRGCREARARTHPDLVIGSPERWRDERSTGESIVSVARSWLADSAGAPIAGERRVVLVEGVDRASEQTQNALLKALEEPTSRHMFVLVADEPTRVLPTIRSRSQSLRVGAVPRAELAAWLVDHERLPADQADDLARLAGGMAGTAIGYARNSELVDWRRRTQRELLGLIERGRADRFGSVRDLLDEAAHFGVHRPAESEASSPDSEAAKPTSAAQRESALLIVEAWLGLARDLLVAAAGRPEIAASAAVLPDLSAVAAQIGQPAIRDFIALLERIRDGLRQSAAPRLALEVAMLAWPSAAAR
jgi:hypothetical protein